MKKIIFAVSLVLLTNCLWGQKLNNAVKLKDLAVPASPAFIITDITPSLIQSPNTPKEFILGVAQSFQESSGGFPQNYSTQFAPYWWAKPDDRNVYTVLGLKTSKDAVGKTNITGQNPFSGLKFTSVSIAFLNKDLIPDTIDASQKILSIGINTTLIKVHLKSYATDINNKITEWHEAAQLELDKVQEEITREVDPERKKALLKKFANYKPVSTSGILEEINEIINRKPIFSWDIAAAHSTYGINDSVWRSGRSGIWTTLSTYLPLALGDERTFKNYLNINFVFRYLMDKYQLNEQKKIVSGNSVDIGGKFALEFDKLSIGIESLYRFKNGEANSQNRTVGIINYKVADNLYIRGAFGKNFNVPDKLIALFGINWGFGSESVNLPK